MSSWPVRNWAHARAGLRHAANFDALVDRTPEQRVLARGLQRDESLRLASDDVIGARRQRLVAEAVEGLLRHVAVGVIGLGRDVEREHQRRDSRSKVGEPLLKSIWTVLASITLALTPIPCSVPEICESANLLDVSSIENTTSSAVIGAPLL